MNPKNRVLVCVVLALIGVLPACRLTLADDFTRLPATPETEVSVRWPLSSLAFTPDGKYLASADLARGLCLWNLKSRQRVWEVELPPVGAVSEENVALAFTADGKSLLLASQVRDPLVLDVSSGKTLRTIGSDGEWFAPAISRWCKSGTETAVTSSGGDLHFWNPSNGKELMVLKGAGRKVISLQVAENAAKIALGIEALGTEDKADTGRVLVRELPSGRVVLDVRQSKLPVRQLAICRNGEYLVGASDEQVVCWSLERKKRLWSTDTACGGLAMSPDGKVLAYGSGSQIVLCDVATGTTLSSTRFGSHTISTVTFTSDGTSIAVGADDGTVAVWKLLEGHEEKNSGDPSGQR